MGQGNTPEKALDKLKQAIESLGELYKSESEVDIRPILLINSQSPEL